MKVTGAMVAKQARSYIGEHEVPMGSNTGPFVVLCQRATFLSGTRWPWCAAFVCYVAEVLKVPLSYASAGAHDLADHHASVSVEKWEPGMVVDFNIGTGHTGILVEAHTDTVTTIDGNWGDKVTEVIHPRSVIRRVWAIPGVDYAHVPAPSPKPGLPPFVVTTSAKGTRRVVFRAKKKAGLIAWLSTNNLHRLFPNGIRITRGKG